LVYLIGGTRDDCAAKLVATDEISIFLRDGMRFGRRQAGGDRAGERAPHRQPSLELLSRDRVDCGAGAPPALTRLIGE